MAGPLTELKEVVSTDESHTEESILCLLTFFCSFFYLSVTPAFLRREE